MRLTYLSAVIATIALLESASVRGQEPRHELRFTADGSGTVLVPVFLGAFGPYNFALDTGSTGSAIADDVAGRLSLPVVSRAEVISPAGRAVRDLVGAGPVRVGPATIRTLLFTLTARAEMARPGVRIDGILGQDFLAAFNYTLDYRRRRVVWHDFDPASGPDSRAGDSRGSRLDFECVDGQFVVTLPPASPGGRPLRFVVDSGAADVVIFTRPQEPRLLLEVKANRFDARGLGGTRTATTVVLRELTVGRLVLRDQPAALIERADRPGIDGLLPLRLFERVTVRSRDGYLVLHR